MSNNAVDKIDVEVGDSDDSTKSKKGTSTGDEKLPVVVHKEEGTKAPDTEMTVVKESKEEAETTQEDGLTSAKIVLEMDSDYESIPES